MPHTKVIDVVSAIHKRVREQEASYETPEVLEDWSNDLAKLNSAYNGVHCARNLVGNVPLLPKTPLGVAAGWAIRFAQKLLFWYTPQIRQFQEAAAGALSRVCALEERKFRSFLAVHQRLEKLEREMRLLKLAQTAPGAEEGAGRSVPRPRPAVDAKDFFFQLQGRFQSSVPADTSRLEMYRAVTARLDPALPEGRWLDLGCGRGKWLGLVREGGHTAAGVDAHAAAVAQCRESGLEAYESDALEFLRAAEEESFAVVSAFHVLEHLPFEYTLNLVYQAARALKRGGVFLIETPHPGNLLMAAEQFWLDPTHNRPIPQPLMAFLFEYCGLRVVHRFEVNPRPESEHLPFRELELASRLDLLLYGPQDYAMMGRREA